MAQAVIVQGTCESSSRPTIDMQPMAILVSTPSYRVKNTIVLLALLLLCVPSGSELCNRSPDIHHNNLHRYHQIFKSIELSRG